jgi:hypothetical protein
MRGAWRSIQHSIPEVSKTGRKEGYVCEVMCKPHRHIRCSHLKIVFGFNSYLPKDRIYG